MFGAALRQLRCARGVSLAQLSQLTHFSKGYLSKVENGHRAASAKLACCCDDALGAAGQLARLLPERAAGGRGMDVPPAQLPADPATFAGRRGPIAQPDPVPQPG